MRAIRGHPRRKILPVGMAVALAWSECRSASAFDAEVEATTSMQSYAVSSPWSANAVLRRRHMQALSLGLYHLEGDGTRPGEPEVFLKLRMRMDVDYGVTDGETSYSTTNGTFIPGLSEAPLDLMYGYLEGRNLARGWLAFRLGRQYSIGSLGFWSFDGALVRLITPFHLAAEVLAGFEQRGGLPLSLPRFEQNGVYRGDRAGFEANGLPQFQKAYLAPAYGASLETSGWSWVHARADLRRVYNHGAVVLSELPDPATGGYARLQETRISSDRLGVEADAHAGELGTVRGGFVYDWLDASVPSGYGTLDWRASERLTFGVDYDYFRPTFDGDSIFSFFAHNAMRTITGRGMFDLGAVELATSVGPRTFYANRDSLSESSTTSDLATAGTQHDWLGDLIVRQSSPSHSYGARASVEHGARGHRDGADLSAERWFEGGHYGLHGRVSLYDWAEAMRPDRGALSFSYVLGATLRSSQIARASVEWEHDINRLVGQRYRVLALLELRVMR